MDGYLVNILGGAWLTLAVAGAALLIALVLGLAAALAKLSRHPVARALGTVYSTVIRGIPDLVLMLLIFYGGQFAVNALAARLGWDNPPDIDPFVAGVATIGFIYGAYLCEIFRGAILSIPPGQAEAGYAFGLTRVQVIRRIVVPQMARIAIPGFTNTWLVMVKSTALVSVIGLTDMLYRAKQASGATHAAFIYFLAAAAVYLAITSVSLWLLGLLDRRLSHSRLAPS